MPLPYVIGLAALGKSAVQMNSLSKTAMNTVRIKKNAIKDLEEQKERTQRTIETFDALKCDIYEQFGVFADLLEQIQGRPEFKNINRNSIILPEINICEMQKMADMASIVTAGLMEGISSAVFMTAATTLNVATGGIGVIFTSALFDKQYKEYSAKIQKDYEDAEEIEEKVEDAILFLEEIEECLTDYSQSIIKVKEAFDIRIDILSNIVEDEKKTSWGVFTEDEKLITENLILLTGLLYKMCKLKLTQKLKYEEYEIINYDKIKQVVSESEQFMDELKEE